MKIPPPHEVRNRSVYRRSVVGLLIDRQKHHLLTPPTERELAPAIP
jgi:hypothetical protein